MKLNVASILREAALFHKKQALDVAFARAQIFATCLKRKLKVTRKPEEPVLHGTGLS